MSWQSKAQAMKRALLCIPLLTSSCVRPTLGHGRYIISYQGNSPGSDGAILLDLNARRASPICDDGNESNMACIAASGSTFSSDLLLLHPITIEGIIQEQKLMVWSKTGQSLILLTDSDPNIKNRNEALGAFSPVERKASFAVIEADQIHSSIWIRDLQNESTRQLTEISSENYWYAYPTWTGDGTAVAYFRVERSGSGNLRARVLKYDLKSESSEELENLSNTVSIAFAPKASDVVAAWTALGLELFDSKTRRLLIPIEWCGTRRLAPNTLAFDESGKYILFSVYDISQKQGQIYQMSIADSKIVEVFMKNGARITSISLTQ